MRFPFFANLNVWNIQGISCNKGNQDRKILWGTGNARATVSMVASLKTTSPGAFYYTNCCFKQEGYIILEALIYLGFFFLEKEKNGVGIVCTNSRWVGNMFLDWNTSGCGGVVVIWFNASPREKKSPHTQKVEKEVRTLHPAIQLLVIWRSHQSCNILTDSLKWHNPISQSGWQVHSQEYKLRCRKCALNINTVRYVLILP